MDIAIAAAFLFFLFQISANIREAQCYLIASAQVSIRIKLIDQIHKTITI